MQIDYENNLIDFGDGEDIAYWWEDMRPEEVRQRLYKAYEKGLNAACPLRKELIEKEKSTADLLNMLVGAVILESLSNVPSTIDGASPLKTRAMGLVEEIRRPSENDRKVALCMRLMDALDNYNGSQR